MDSRTPGDAPTPSPEYVAANREVQRLLGRCLLRSQQAERALKAIIVAHYTAGSGHDTASLASRRAADVAKLGLGEVVDLFLEDVVRISVGSEKSEARPAKRKPKGRPGRTALLSRRQAEAQAAAVDAGKPWFTTTLTIETPQEDAQALLRELRTMVVLRNRVVHNFSEEHEIRTLHGCERAVAFLSEADATLCRHLETIKVWAMTMDEARSAYARAMSEPGVLDALVDAASAAPRDEEL